MQVIAWPMVHLTNRPHATTEEIGNPERIISGLGPCLTNSSYEVLEISLQLHSSQTVSTLPFFLLQGLFYGLNGCEWKAQIHCFDFVKCSSDDKTAWSVWCVSWELQTRSTFACVIWVSYIISEASLYDWCPIWHGQATHPSYQSDPTIGTTNSPSNVGATIQFLNYSTLWQSNTGTCTLNSMTAAWRSAGSLQLEHP